MKKLAYLLTIGLLLFPSAAYANAGTPLMWASILHLVFGNAIIGLIEGFIVAWKFKCSKWKTILILIAANYVSAWAGGLLVAGGLASLPDITIQNIRFWFLAFLVAAFVVTILIEFPFFWLAMRSKGNSMRRTILATLIINVISYVFLFGWYWTASGTSMLTRLEVVPAETMELSEPYSLYFISRDGNQICQMNLCDPESIRSVAKVVAHHRNDRLFARPRTDSGFDLLLFLDSDDRRAGKETKILEDFSDDAPIDWRIKEGHSGRAEGTWSNFGPVPIIGKKSDWEFDTAFWAFGGISGNNTKTGMSLRFSLELPFAAWYVRNATQIPGEYVVAQLGEDQICLMHLESDPPALIARGKGPVVAKTKISFRLDQR